VEAETASAINAAGAGEAEAGDHAATAVDPTEAVLAATRAGDHAAKAIDRPEAVQADDHAAKAVDRPEAVHAATRAMGDTLRKAERRLPDAQKSRALERLLNAQNIRAIVRRPPDKRPLHQSSRRPPGMMRNSSKPQPQSLRGSGKSNSSSGGSSSSSPSSSRLGQTCRQLHCSH